MTADAELLQSAVNEVARLLEADGAMIYLVDDSGERLRFAHDAGITNPEARRLVRDLTLPIGVGMFGTAVAEGALLVTDDYPADRRFTHAPLADQIANSAGMRSMVVAPLQTEGQPIGAMGAYSCRPAAFTEAQIVLLRALADHAAGAIANQRLMSQLAHRVEAQQTLQAITARITAIRDPDEVLQQVVDAAKRLLGSDGAHLTLRDPSAPILRPHVMAGGMDEATRAWLAELEFPIGGGMNGLAARDGAPIWTRDYLVDPRIPHEDLDQEVAVRMGLRGMAVAPLRAPEGEIFGTLAISYEEPRDIIPDQIELLQGLADVGAIAIANANLYGRLHESEERYRFLVDSSPDLIFATGADGHFTYLSDTAEQLLGWKPEEMVGRHFSEYVSPQSMDVVMEHWQRAIEEPERRQQYRLWIPHRDGSHFPGEINAVGEMRDGKFVGAHGSVRDIRERVALEEDLRRQADELARVVDAQRALSAIAAQISAIRDPADVLQRTVDVAYRLLGADFALINPLGTGGRTLELSVAFAPAATPLNDVVLTPGEGVSGTAIAERRVVRTGDYLHDPGFRHTPGADAYIREQGISSVMSAPLVSGDEAIGTLSVQSARTHAFTADDEQLLQALAGQAAVAITNARLIEQIEESERRYRFLVDRSPDLVWAVDVDGQFTYLGEALERMTGFRPEELIGQHWRALVAPESIAAGEAAWAQIRERPDEDLQFRVVLPLAGGGTMAGEVNMVGTVVDGRFAGAQGSIRDIRERERLEEDLRLQAGALAANAERANLARELHDSVTQALFSMGLTARALELLLDRDPAAARQKLTELRELQKDALAEMRTLIFELRPQALETDGLAQALRNHCAAVEGRTGLAVRVEVEHADRLPLEIEEALYRIAQEALHNVVKHANAGEARISLKRVGNELRLTIDDDGIGFDAGEAPRGHLGVVGMQQRAERIGAELAIARRPSGGSRVRVTLPLARVPSDDRAAASVE